MLRLQQYLHNILYSDICSFCLPAALGDCRVGICCLTEELKTRREAEEEAGITFASILLEMEVAVLVTGWAESQISSGWTSCPGRDGKKKKHKETSFYHAVCWEWWLLGSLFQQDMLQFASHLCAPQSSYGIAEASQGLAIGDHTPLSFWGLKFRLCGSK